MPVDTVKERQQQIETVRSKETVRILALESSCDETAAAVIENGRTIISNVIFSQVDVHALYGGDRAGNCQPRACGCLRPV